MTKAKKTQIEEDFRGYMGNNYPPKSVSTYISNIGFAVRHCGISDIWEALDCIDCVVVQVRQVDVLLDRIDIAICSSGALNKRLSDARSAANKLKEFLMERKEMRCQDCSNCSARAGSLIWKGTTKPKTPQRIQDGITNPLPTPRNGKDEKIDWIRYADNVAEEKQVPGLRKALWSEYECIIGFERKILERLVPDSHIPDISYIPVILSPECPAKIYYNDDTYVAEKVRQLVRDGRTVTADELRAILYFSDRVTGRFFSSGHQAGGPYIEIYYRQFTASCWEEYVARLVNVLAHEYAHYIEYCICRQQGEPAFTDERVSEAIADFAGVLYMLKRVTSSFASPYDLTIAQTRYSTWRDRLGSSWPYAYAWHFVKDMPSPLHTDLTDYDQYPKPQSAIQKLAEAWVSTSYPAAALRIIIQ